MGESRGLASGVLWDTSLVFAFLALVLMVGVVGVPAGVAQGRPHPTGQLGFDRNDYPGEVALDVLRRHFTFAGYWLNAPPEEQVSSWLGHRETMVRAGFGFLLLWNGKLDAEILRAAKAGQTPEALGRAEAEAATRVARTEGFPSGAVIFLDQEEGGRLLPEQASFMLAWTEGVVRGGYGPGVYASGQVVDEGPAPGSKGRVTITTVEDIRARITAGGLHTVEIWVAQDACAPAPGCVLAPPIVEGSGTAAAAVWQFAQSPRRPELTRACARTYGTDRNCTVPELPGVHLDLSVAKTADPSHGR